MARCFCYGPERQMHDQVMKEAVDVSTLITRSQIISCHCRPFS